MYESLQDANVRYLEPVLWGTNLHKVVMLICITRQGHLFRHPKPVLAWWYQAIDKLPAVLR